MRDQSRISGADGNMSGRIMRHSYKDKRHVSRERHGSVSADNGSDVDRISDCSCRNSRRSPCKKRKSDSETDGPDIDAILEENMRLRKENERSRDENRIFREELEMKGVEIESLLEQNKVLTRRVNMNSTNSSKPPSNDGYRKPSPRSLRPKSELKRGGRHGHRGHNMPIPHEPDEVVLHYPDVCKDCPNFVGCSNGCLVHKESRYVVDIVTTTKVTEHRVLRAESCLLSESSDRLRGQFPRGCRHMCSTGIPWHRPSAYVQYGAVSHSRISELMRGMFGVNISPGTAVSMVSRCASKVAPALEAIKQSIIGSDVCHFDETGARAEGRLFWVHNSSTREYTYQTIDKKRGVEGIDRNGVLPAFRGTAIHDCWLPYWRYGISHGTCCAHYLRELRGIEDMEPSHVWPRLFRIFLLAMKSTKEDAQSRGSDNLPIEGLRAFDERFDRIMVLADRECPQPLRNGRNRVKKGT